MLVRAATTADSNRVATLHAMSWRHAYRDVLSGEYLASDIESDRLQLWESRLAEPTERQHVLLAEDSGQLLGFACVYVGEDQEWGSYLNNIHVAPATQGKGIGRLLLHAIAKACSESHPGGLYLWVLQSNSKAQGFYARYGARNTGTDIWEAPDGTTAPLFRFSWQSAAQLQAKTANPFIEQASAHVKRWAPQLAC